jgi:hypothetical protein
MRRTLRVNAAKGRAGQMARSTSTLRTMRAVSAVLVLAVAGLVAVGVNEMRHWDILTGWELIAWAFVPLTILLGFTVPVRCKVKRTNRQACGNWAYGLLFGCRRAAGHWHEKFAARLRLPDKEVKPVERRQPAGGQAFNYQPTPQGQPVRVTVEDSTLGVCGFWISAVSMVATVIGVIVAVVH